MLQNHFDSNQIDQLHQILELEVEQYQQAVNALQRKKAALVSRKPQNLIPVDRELMAINRKGKQLEQQRQSLMTALGQPDGRLEKMIAQMDPANANRFQNTRQRLLRTIEDVKHLNGESRSLLTLSLHWIQETVDIITAAISPEGASYNAQGEKRKGSENPPPIIQSTISHSV